MSAAKVRVKFTELPEFLTPEDRARGFREYAVERHVGQVAATVGIVTRDSNGEWMGLHLGPVRAWTPRQRSRAAVVAALVERAEVTA